MSRRKTWDVQDPNRLRRSLEANDKIVDDEYFTRWITPHAFSLGATASHVVIEDYWSAIQYTQASTQEAAATWYWPQWWRYGRLSMISYWYHTAASGTGVVLDHAVYGREPDSTSTLQLISDSSTHSVTTDGNPQLFIVELSSTVKERGDNELLGIMIDRKPLESGDDVNAVIDCLGVRLNWKPEPR